MRMNEKNFTIPIWYTDELDKKTRKEKNPIIFIPEDLMGTGKKIVYGKFVYSGGVFDFVIDKVVDCDEIIIHDNKGD